MTVSIVNEGGKIAVEVKKADAPKGSPAEVGIKVPVENQEQAEALKVEFEKAEKTMQEKTKTELQTAGVDSAKVAQGTPKEGEAKKLDTAA